MVKIYRSVVIMLMVFCGMHITYISFGQNAKTVVNYFGTPDSITFNGVNHFLSWSSHPNAEYYKHEYLLKGDVAEHFKDMVMLEFLQGQLSAADAVQAQVNTLNARKQTDIICNYNVLRSRDSTELILDFIVSEGNGKRPALVEWSAYRYKKYTDALGHTGVLMLGISHRAYKKDVQPFLQWLRYYRQGGINSLATCPFPKIAIK